MVGELFEVVIGLNLVANVWDAYCTIGGWRTMVVVGVFWWVDYLDGTQDF
jgi:hypothetical protein